MTLPPGAGQILAIRKTGKRPADLVIVSNVGKLPFENPVVTVDGVQDYDWRWLVGLPFVFYGAVDACLFANLENICKALKGRLPNPLLIWDANSNEGFSAWFLPTAETIHLPGSLWEWEFSFQEWSEYQNKKFMGIQ